MPFFLYNPRWRLAEKTNVMAKYTQDSHIATAEDVQAFFRHIVYDLNINFHPDDDFADYVDLKTGKRTMDDETAALYNRLMEEAFDAVGEDVVYEMACNLLKKRLKV